MRINGQTVDLSQGNMFVIRTQDSEFDIIQLACDLLGIGSGNAAIEAMATDDPGVAVFAEQVGG